MKKNEQFVWVDPKSSLFGQQFEGDEPKPPWRINFSQYGFQEGDYVGVAKQGKFRYKSPEKMTSNSLCMRYGSAAPRELSSEQEIIRLTNGTIAEFGPNDIFFKDNEDPSKKYGVVLSFVNSLPPLRMDTKDSRKSEDPNKPMLSIFASESGTYSAMQYRGWYGGNSRKSWKPHSSHWHGRPDNKHEGIDIFSTFGTTIFSPVAGEFEAGYGSDFGRYAMISFTQGGRKKFLYLCHLSKLLISKKTKIAAGTAVGLSGCTGNAKTGLPCGSSSRRNEFGGRSDHVHMEVKLDKAVNGAITEDPVVTFGWQGLIKYSDAT